MCFEEIAVACALGTWSDGQLATEQKYLCRASPPVHRDYRYQGCALRRRLIVPMTLNGSLFVTSRESCTFPSTRSQSRGRSPQDAGAASAASGGRLRIDEMWSFVEKKKNQSWLWYAFSPKTKQVIGYVRGRRTDAVCAQLLAKLSSCQVTRFYTDWWDSYGKLIPSHRHWVGKAGTQRIERNNLTIRTRLKRWQRRTICFSKSDEMDEAWSAVLSSQKPSAS